MLMLGFLILVFSPCIAPFNSFQTHEDFRRCPAGNILNGSLLQSVSTRSKLDCMAQCSHTVDCRGVNVCPDTASRRVDCTMFSEINLTVCDDLDRVYNTSCFFVNKCQNGGQPVGKKCKCRIGFLGDYCERYMRDCKEAQQQPGSEDYPNGIYYIHPITAPAPFQVYCRFSEYQFNTSPLLRVNASFAKLKWDWDSAKKTQYQDDSNFFAGMENLHHLLAQAEYTLKIDATGEQRSFGCVYENFTLAGEAESYAFRYTSFIDMHIWDYNIFNGTPPINFCTDTRDPLGCVAERGFPGWYGSDCSGYSLFVYPLMLPVYDIDTRYEIFEMSLMRPRDFY